jgi:hypothetical protein
MPLHEANIFHSWVLDQDDTWVDIYGREHSLAYMDRDYLEAVLMFLLRSAKRRHMAYLENEDGINPAELEGAALHRFYAEPVLQAQRWMLRTCLVTRILSLLGDGGDPLP